MKSEFRLIRPILSEASRQMMEIRVSGPVDQPRIVSEAFPGARQFLQQVQDDMRRSTEGQDVLGPAARCSAKAPARASELELSRVTRVDASSAWWR